VESTPSVPNVGSQLGSQPDRRRQHDPARVVGSAAQRAARDAHASEEAPRCRSERRRLP
jgi:hypothetical protein